MSAGNVEHAESWANGGLALELFAVAPAALGGLSLRGSPGPARDRLLSWLRDLLPAGAPLCRLPVHVTEDRLLGGLSLAATLRAGRVIEEPGLLARVDGGVLIASSSERLDPGTTAHLCGALDRGELLLERDGLARSYQCRLGVVALDEGIDGERTPEALRDRLAFCLDLSGMDAGADQLEPLDSSRVVQARARFASVDFDDELLQSLCQVASALGISSLRAPLLAVAVARAHAALEGRARVDEEDAAVAGRLVLGPRATRAPVLAEEPTEEQSSESTESSNDESEDEDDERPGDQVDPPEAEPTRDVTADSGRLEELVLEGAKSGIPAGLLDGLASSRVERSPAARAGRAGELRNSNLGGRPAGVRPGQPRGGERLNVVETLRAAAPWQLLRRRERRAMSTLDTASRRLEIRKDDLRVTRFQQRAETGVIFAVDASGSAALQRLAEAKGAVEQVLADCYVRRDHVALISFRGSSASLLLPPTRSLVSVRRSLSSLAGGGTTPLAAGIDAALALALDARRRGQTPVLVLMTDGRANVARDGRGDRKAALADALAAARMVRSASVRALFLDTSPRPRAEARLLASAMSARYLPLPYFDAPGISRQVQSLAEQRL